jgi:hypothetical protein
MEGKKHLGCSSPAKPALITPDPYIQSRQLLQDDDGLFDEKLSLHCL